jgi:DMSO/TMAO reductase YedYZ heme-binding membrane subunit
MPIKKQGYVFIAAVIVLFVTVSALAVSIFSDDFVSLLVRLFALYGYTILSVATIMTPFLKESVQAFGKPFIKIHHTFSVFGLLFITLHPVSYAIQVSRIDVFLPKFDSWEIFWQLAGRPALILFYVALFAALLRMKSPRYWRFFHVLMYVVLFFGIVHANLMGTDFQSVVIKAIFYALFFASIGAFAYKRYRNYRMRQMFKMQKRS